MVMKSTAANPDPNPNSGEMKYKGVRKRNWGKWVSEIRLPHSRERIWLGSYDSAEKAARAFDAAQICLRGPADANLNFPENPPQIDGAAKGLSPTEIQLVASKFANASHPPEAAVAEEEASASALAPSESPSCSLSISDGAVQWEGGDVSFDGGAGLFYNYYDFNPLGSDNYETDFGFYTALPQQSDSLDYYEFDHWNESGCQNSSLWNF